MSVQVVPKMFLDAESARECIAKMYKLHTAYQQRYGKGIRLGRPMDDIGVGVVPECSFLFAAEMFYRLATEGLRIDSMRLCVDPRAQEAVGADLDPMSLAFVCYMIVAKLDVELFDEYVCFRIWNREGANLKVDELEKLERLVVLGISQPSGLFSSIPSPMVLHDKVKQMGMAGAIDDLVQRHDRPAKRRKTLQPPTEAGCLKA